MSATGPQTLNLCSSKFLLSISGNLDRVVLNSKPGLLFLCRFLDGGRFILSSNQLKGTYNRSWKDPHVWLSICLKKENTRFLGLSPQSTKPDFCKGLDSKLNQEAKLKRQYTGTFITRVKTNFHNSFIDKIQNILNTIFFEYSFANEIGTVGSRGRDNILLNWDSKSVFLT